MIERKEQQAAASTVYNKNQITVIICGCMNMLLQYVINNLEGIIISSPVKYARVCCEYK